jgi:3'-5' exonuclease
VDKTQPTLQQNAAAHQQQAAPQNTNNNGDRIRMAQEKKEEEERRHEEAKEKQKKDLILLVEEAEGKSSTTSTTAHSAINTGGSGNNPWDSDDDGDDSDYDDEEEEFDEDQDEIIGSDGSRQPIAIRQRQGKKYMPPPGSFLEQQLSVLHEKMMKPENSKTGSSRYFRFSMDPIGKPGQPRPENWYQKNIVAMDWRPFTHYNHLVGDLRQYQCMGCNKSGTLNSKSHHWRPMFCTEEIVWLHHRRVECQSPSCRKTFAECDPRFLKQLPEAIVQAFPFETTVNGPGMAKHMINSFLCLATKGIMYGTFANMQNEQYRIKYTNDHYTFLLASQAYHSRSILNFFNVDGPQSRTMPGVFAPFYSPGLYHGMLLSPALVRKMFTCHMEKPEVQEDLEKRFQMSCDEGASPDHTHKYAKGIKIPGRPGHPFTASYTIMSLGGLLTNSSLTQSKNNSELDHLLDKHREVRINAGQPKLLRVEADGGPDRILWEQKFPELKDGVTRYQHLPTDGLVQVVMEKDEFVLLTDAAAAANWIMAFTENIGVADELLVAFDMEWDSNLSLQGIQNVPTRLLGLSLHVPKTRYTRNVVFDLYKICRQVDDDNVAGTAGKLPVVFNLLFKRRRTTFCGFHPGNDISRLNNLGVALEQWTNVRRLALEVAGADKHPNGYSLAAMCAQHLGLYLDKSGQKANYSQAILPMHLYEYQAMDCYITLKLYLKLKTMDPRTAASKLQHGTKATLTTAGGRIDCAEVQVEFMGDGIEQRKWGIKTIGKNLAIVRLVRVLAPGAMIPISFEPPPPHVQ